MAQALSIKAIVNVVDGQLRLMGAAPSLKGGVRCVQSSVEELVLDQLDNDKQK